MAAPVGNQFAKKARIWTDAIERALARREREQRPALDHLADKLLEKCEKGDLTAMQELGNRLEGKPHQLVVGPGDEGEHKVEVSWRAE